MDLIKLNDVLWKGDIISCYIAADNVASFYSKDNKTMIHTKNDERYVVNGDVTSKMRMMFVGNQGRVFEIKAE